LLNSFVLSRSEGEFRQHSPCEESAGAVEVAGDSMMLLRSDTAKVNVMGQDDAPQLGAVKL
jgi:hypothetical protein